MERGRFCGIAGRPAARVSRRTIANVPSRSRQLYRPELQDLSSPGWRPLCVEEAPAIVLDETDEVTLIVILGRHGSHERGFRHCRGAGNAVFMAQPGLLQFLSGVRRSRRARDEEKLFARRELRGSGPKGEGPGDLRGEEQPWFRWRRLNAYSGYAMLRAWVGRSKPSRPSTPKSRPCR